jgi:DNA-binding transcriptional MerR regulator
MAAKRKSARSTASKKTPGRKARGSTSAASSPSTDAIDANPPRGDKLYYRIGEAAKLTGIKPYVLRYWESEFRWMAPQKSRSKQRLYRRKDIDTILLIKRLLYEERYTIAGARKLLREMGVGRATETVEAKTLDHRSEYKRIRDELLAIRASL